jgi:predicted RNA methylase
MTRIKRRIENLEEAFWDSLLGINTRSIDNDHHLETVFRDPTCYQSKCYYLIWRYLRPVRMTNNDVFYDIGCGSGRLLCVASLTSVRKCVGIEVSARLCEQARNNIERFRFHHAPIEIRTQDAAAADYTSGSVFALFNPFGPATMKVVLDLIGQSLERSPRHIQLIYINPTAQQVFDRAKWLHLVATKSFVGSPLSVCYYQNK